MKNVFSSRIWFLSIILCFAFSVPGDRSLIQIPVSVWSIYAGDLDLDNDVDLLTGHDVAFGKNNKSLSVINNDGTGIFYISDTSKSYTGYQENIFAVNMDNDILPDIVSFYSERTDGINHRFIRIWQNANGEFNTYSDVSLNSTATFDGINHGDYNGDGSQDIVVYSNSQLTWGVLFNIGNLNFTSPVYYSLSFPPQNIECGDLNSDGKDEIIVSGSPTEMYFYNSNFEFDKVILDSAHLEKTIISDIDLDNDNDIVGYNYNFYQNKSRVYSFINENGSFTKYTSLVFDGVTLDQLCNDLDGDSLPDIAFLFKSPEVNPDNPPGMLKGIQINFNNGNYQFNQQDSVIIYFGGELWRDFSCSDFDGNGYNDFAVTRYYSRNLLNNLEIFYNDGNGNFQPTPVKVKENRLNEVLKCFPNPFINEIKIEFQTKNYQLAKIVIYNTIGEQIKTVASASYPGTNQICIKDLNSLSKGVYFIVLYLDVECKAITKIVKA